MKGWILAGLLTCAGLQGAAAEGASGGHGVVVAKDLAQGRLTLLDGRVLRVSERTRIAGVDGERAGLAAVAVAERTGGGFGAVPGSSIAFETTGRGGEATWIRILPSPVE